MVLTKCFDLPEYLGSKFAAHAGWVYERTFKTIWGALLFILVLTSGAARFFVQTSTEILYSPAGSQAHLDFDSFAEIFPAQAYPSIPIYQLSISKPGVDLLRDPDVINEFVKFNIAVQARPGWQTSWTSEKSFFKEPFDTSKGESEGKYLTTGPQGLCARSAKTGACTIWSPLNPPPGENATAPTLPVTICGPRFLPQSSGEIYSSLQIVSGPFSPDAARAWPAADCLPGMREFESAEALRSSFQGTDYAKFKEFYTQEITWLADEYLQKIEEALDYKENGYTISVFNQATRDVELSKSVVGDIPLFLFSIILLTNFAIFSFIPAGMHVVAIMDVLGGLLAVLGSVGFGSLIGVEFNSAVAFFPFLLLGTSVDDTFIMLRALQTVPVKGHSPQYRVVEMLRKSAPSMFMTSCTDILAFAVGAISSTFPAVTAFCLFATFGNVLDFIMQVTWCVAWVGVDARRQALERRPAILTVATPRKIVRDAEDLPEPTETEIPETHYQNNPGDLQQTYESALQSKVVRVISAILYAVLLYVGIWGILNKLIVGQKLSQLAPSDSYAQPYYADKALFFSAEGPPFDLMLTVDRDGNSWAYHDPAVQAQINTQIVQPFADVEWESRDDAGEWRSYSMFDGDTRQLWWNSMAQYHMLNNITTDTTQAGFGQQVKDYLVLRPDLAGDIKMKGFEIEASLVSIQSTLGTVDDPTWRGNIYKAVQVAQTEAESLSGVPVPVVLNGNRLKFFAADAEMLGQVVFSLGASVAGVLLILLAFVPDWRVAALCTVTLCSIDVFVLGYMSLMEQSVNTVSMMVLILSVGFSIDCIAHVCLAYVLVPVDRAETRLERVTQAVRDVGTPVLQAGLSTLFGIFPTAFSQSQIFFNFFIITFFVIVFGLAHGLLIVPILLSFIGPMPNDEERKALAAKMRQQKKARAEAAGIDLEAVEKEKADRAEAEKKASQKKKKGKSSKKKSSKKSSGKSSSGKKKSGSSRKKETEEERKKRKDKERRRRKEKEAKAAKETGGDKEMKEIKVDKETK